MKPQLLHQEAMKISFKAKKALTENQHDIAHNLFQKAAQMESKVARFYFDKPENEPTRSIIIRSAAFLNLKAGEIKKAKEFIFFGLLNSKDVLIQEQLNDALEYAMTIGTSSTLAMNEGYNYLNLLEKESVHYTLEPTHLKFGKVVSLNMIRDFSTEFLKSFKSYALATSKRIKSSTEFSDLNKQELEILISPLLTSSSLGSFKFSIANDTLPRGKESKEFILLKNNFVRKFHTEVFTNPLTNEHIRNFRDNYNEEELNKIFGPLTKIKSEKSPYSVSYYDDESFRKVPIPSISKTKRDILLPKRKSIDGEIGKLENNLSHILVSKSGKIARRIIAREHIKSYTFEKIIKEIPVRGDLSIIFKDDFRLKVEFDSKKGFKFSSSDFQIEHSNSEYEQGLKNLYSIFYDKLVKLSTKKRKNDLKLEWDSIKNLFVNLDSVIKSD